MHRHTFWRSLAYIKDAVNVLGDVIEAVDQIEGIIEHQRQELIDFTDSLESSEIVNKLFRTYAQLTENEPQTTQRSPRNESLRGFLHKSYFMKINLDALKISM